MSRRRRNPAENVTGGGKPAVSEVVAAPIKKTVCVRAAGVNVAGGVLLLAVAERRDEGPALPIALTNPRLVPNTDLEEAHGLRDLSKRVKQELEAARVDTVGLVQTRAFRNLQYNVVYPRIVSICAVMLAASDLNLGFETIATETIGAAVGLPPKSLELFDFSVMGLLERPTYWTSGLAEAYAAAVTLVGGVS